MKSYRISPKKWLSAFSTAENRLCRTIVRRRDAFRRFCIFFISPRFGSAEKRRSKKRIRVWFGLLYGTNCIKADEILSDFSEEIIIRFFYRRKPPLPYNCTATWRFSTILYFFISPRLDASGILTDSCIKLYVFTFPKIKAGCRKTSFQQPVRQSYKATA